MTDAHRAIAEVFSVLHDGVIVAVREEHVGSRRDLVLEVDIRYLAERIAKGHVGFVVRLEDVTELRYLPWQNQGEPAPPPVKDVIPLLLSFDILGGKVDQDEAVVTVLRNGRIVADAGGDVVFRATAIDVTDRAGTPWSSAALADLARGYWEEFRRRTAKEE